ncbi:MAG: PKD domain-containing protein [Saprospiraceae bacterium]|uniref:PKD domain-containing protein n=1 Tax=Candidatus Opimibacter skivensis TaxID=2982028 RepID=A0A9D7SYC6_9BACT|nr:PKD domain-containing protein [Candidatus Opimibacter skivensis]
MRNTHLRVFSICSLLSLFILASSFGQSKIRFNVQRATPSEDAAYRKEFKSYKIGTFDAKATSDMLRSKDDHDAIELQVENKTFAFDLHAHDLRTPNFRLTVQDENGVRDLPAGPNTTYYGYTDIGNHAVRITADDNFFYALIIEANDEFYIEPAYDIVPTADPSQYIMYWKSDVLTRTTNNACGVRNAPQHIITPDEDNTSPENLNRSRDLCKTVQIALVDDHLMYIKYGSSIPNVTNHNMGVINNVQANYDTEFNPDFVFSVTQVYVSTGTDPWTNSTDPNLLLDDFTNWGPSHLSTHDVASLWTNRDFNSNVIGLAWVEAVCTSVRYNVLQDFTTDAQLLRVLQAHELGHNFGANHDSGGGFIMSPSVSNTNTWSAQSITAVNNYIGTVNCLSSCSAPAAPIAEFNSDNTDGCVVFTVHFFDQSQNSPTSWLWTLPGGTPATSTLQNPTVAYNTAGSYNVTLKATNAQGMNTITKTNYITVGDDPVSDFDFTQNGLVVTFQNLSVGATSYLWNFGDGNTSTQTNPVHTYNQDGTYNVKLTAINDCGSDITTITIVIITPPIAAFDAAPTEGCPPMEVEFFNLSSTNADSYQWNFPGGSPPSSNSFEPTVVYETPGTFNVTLTVSNDAGDDVLTKTNFITVYPQPASTFTSTVNGLQVTFSSLGSVGDTYLWNFGDGQTSTAHNPTHIYAIGGNYTVTLTMTNNCGSNVHTSTVSLAGTPVAAFTSDVVSGCAPLVVHYINQSVGTVTLISWTFQGGTPSSSNQANPVVTYNAPGTYDVTLTVTNNAGSDDLFMNNYVTVFPETVSDFVFNINGPQVNFFNQSSQSTGSGWSFGDGDVSDEDNPVHVYSADGTYTVYLVSSGLCGNDTSSAVITISTPPTAHFTFSQNGTCAPATVQYANQSSANTTSVEWTFPGGTPSTSTQLNPLVTYNTAGTYDATMIAHSAAGADTFTLSQIVTIGEATVASFLISTNGQTVNFENQSTGGDTYLWLFGDGQTSTETNPSHTYAAFGTYTISLISSNECNDDTMTIEIVLSTIPNAFFSYDVHSGCAPMTVQFFDQSQNNPTAWLWTFAGGDPATSPFQNPSVTYNVPGNYTVTLRVENSQGADVLILMDLINIAGPPDATFDHVVNGNLVTLFYPGMDYDSIRWDFGDGRTDTSLNPTVDYSNSAQYIISLVVYNACGIDTQSVTVNIEGSATNDPSENDSHWQVRPNPFGDKFSIYGEPLKNGSMTISLLDINGKLISKQDWNYASGPSSIDLSADQLPSGIILVQLQDGNVPVILKAVHQ